MTSKQATLIDPATPQEALTLAIELVGGQTALARAVSDLCDHPIEQGHVWAWLNRNNKIPAEYCPAIEQITKGKVTAKMLRPDFPWPIPRRKND